LINNPQYSLFSVQDFTKDPEVNIIPFYIDQKYISFLYKSFENKYSRYMKDTVQTIYIYPSSSFFKYLSLLADKSKVPVKIENCNIFFSVNELGYKSGIYKKKSGKYSLLEIPPEYAKDLTNYIHDYFINTMVAYVDGYLAAKKEIMDGVISFMDKYELWDHWNKRYLHRQYYREKRSGQTPRLFFNRK
jgi:hypothetical protein